MATVGGSREEEVARLFDQLARYQWWMRRLSRARPGQALAVRKKLRAGMDQLEGVERLNSWLWRLVGPAAKPRVLDVGAGFGDTLLSWAAEHEGDYLGLDLSGYQVDRATDQARILGLSDSCQFVRRAFDQPLEGFFDLIVSIETLFHAPDVRGTIRHLASALAPGAVLVLVEDMTPEDGVATTTAGRELLDRWSTPRLHAHADYLEGLQASGLELEFDIDLSELLVLSSEVDRERRRRRLKRLRGCLPLGRSVVDAFLGGLAMEELQSRGDLNYRALGARCRR